MSADIVEQVYGFVLFSLSPFIKNAGYIPGKDVNIAIDVAASEFYKDGKYHLVGESRTLTTDELIECVSKCKGKDIEITYMKDGNI